MVFYVKKLKIRIEYSFLLIISFSLLFGNNDILFLMLFSSLHEFAHLFALKLFKGRAKEINVSFYGIGLKYSYDFVFYQDLIFLLSGVLVNFLFAVLDIHREINLALALINILPIYPLDGGRALKLILNKAFSLRISDRVFIVISVIVVISMLLFSVIQRNLSVFLISIYVLIYSFNNRGFYD